MGVATQTHVTIQKYADTMVVTAHNSKILLKTVAYSENVNGKESMKNGSVMAFAMIYRAIILPYVGGMEVTAPVSKIPLMIVVC